MPTLSLVIQGWILDLGLGKQGNVHLKSHRVMFYILGSTPLWLLWSSRELPSTTFISVLDVTWHCVMSVYILFVCIYACVCTEWSLRQARLSVIENHCHILPKLFREAIKICLAVCMHERTLSYQTLILLLWPNVHSKRLHRVSVSLKVRWASIWFQSCWATLSPILKWITLVMMTMIKAISHYCSASAQSIWLHLKWYFVLLK